MTEAVPLEGFVYFRKQDLTLRKYYLVLTGTDLVSYHSDLKTKIKFLHSLSGCFVTSNPKEDFIQDNRTYFCI